MATEHNSTLVLPVPMDLLERGLARRTAPAGVRPDGAGGEVPTALRDA